MRKRTSNFPFPLSLPLSFSSSSFPFLFLSLRPYFVFDFVPFFRFLTLSFSFICSKVPWKRTGQSQWFFQRSCNLRPVWHLGDPGDLPRENFSIQGAETQIFVKIGIKLAHEKSSKAFNLRPNRRTCVPGRKKPSVEKTPQSCPKCRGNENSCAGAEGELKDLTWSSKNPKNQLMSSISVTGMNGLFVDFCVLLYCFFSFSAVHLSHLSLFRSVYVDRIRNDSFGTEMSEREKGRG